MNDEENSYYAIMRSVAPYLTLGLQLALAVTMFYFIGKYADDRLDTTPWLMTTGIILGFVGGMIKFFRTAMKLSKKEDDERRNKS